MGWALHAASSVDNPKGEVGREVPKRARAGEEAEGEVLKRVRGGEEEG